MGDTFTHEKENEYTLVVDRFSFKNKATHLSAKTAMHSFTPSLKLESIAI